MLHFIEEAARNIRYALRNLRKSPAFSLAAVASLALGIGINTFIFSVFDSLILRPLPIAEPARVTFIETANVGAVSFPDYKEFRDRNKAFSGLAGYRISVMNFEHGGDPLRMWCYLATGNYFDLLGVKPALGRFFHQGDDLHPGASPYVVLSYATWQSRFGGDPRVVGSSVRVNGLSYTVLGVAPREFHGTELFYWPEVWIPMMMQPQVEVGNAWLDERSTWDTMMIGRVKPGVSRAQASADLNRIASDLARQYPQADKELRMRLSEPGFLGSGLRAPVEAFTGGLLILAALVLLTACSNIASLMLARITDRQRELAIRVSIGAGRIRIAAQLLTESLVVAFIGGLLGGALALAASKLLSGWRAPLDFPVQLDVRPDWRVLGYALAATLVTGLLFGLAPALRALRTDSNSLLKGGMGVQLWKANRRLAMRDLILIVQTAFSFVLVFGCIVALQGLQKALTMQLGFEQRNVAVGAVDLGSAGYSEAQGRLFQKRVADTLRSLPGIDSVSYANSLPLSIDQSSTRVERTDEVEQPGRSWQRANYYQVAPGLLKTLQVPLLRGRDFDEHDSEHAPPVAIVNQAFAHAVLQTDDPVGKTFRYGPKSPAIRIIGLVADGKYVSLTEAPDPVVFRCILQDYNPTTTFVVRSRQSAASVVADLRRRIHTLDSKLPLYGTGSLESMLGFALFPMHAAAIALSAFGGLALVLTMTGIFGLVDYAVARRTRELGIRIAIGAQWAEILWQITGKLAVLVCAGLGAGLAMVLALAPALSAVVYTTSPRDPVLLTAVSILLVAAALIASCKPVLRALRVDPVRALRGD